MSLEDFTIPDLFIKLAAAIGVAKAKPGPSVQNIGPLLKVYGFRRTFDPIEDYFGIAKPSEDLTIDEKDGN